MNLCAPGLHHHSNGYHLPYFFVSMYSQVPLSTPSSRQPEVYFVCRLALPFIIECCLCPAFHMAQCFWVASMPCGRGVHSFHCWSDRTWICCICFCLLLDESWISTSLDCQERAVFVTVKLPAALQSPCFHMVCGRQVVVCICIMNFLCLSLRTKDVESCL